MNKLIGITGMMCSFKTTLSKKILDLNKDYIYINVDEFRRSLYNNKNYLNELRSKISVLKNEPEINSLSLNKYIYNNEIIMKLYKETLYKYLFEYIESFDNKTIIVDWALILNDKLDSKFDKIIYLKTSEKAILERLSKGDLSKEEIITRINLQKIDNFDNYDKTKILVVDNTNIDISIIMNFINSIDCKFSITDSKGKAIWEITHNCNYGCSYCIFSCNKNKIYDELNKNECFHIIDELVSNNFAHLKITGGEPFLRRDIIEILKYASENLETDISTNASMITDDIVRELNKIKLKMIHVSLDGNKKEHEIVRGKNTYERTIRGLKALENSINKVRVGTVININNQNNLENLVKDSIELKADEIIFSIMESVDDKSKKYIKTLDDDELFDNINALKGKYQDQIIINSNFKSKISNVNMCPAGDKFIYINNFGYVSPCTWIYEKDKSFISSISLKDNSLQDVLKDERIDKFLSYKKSGVCYGKI